MAFPDLQQYLFAFIIKKAKKKCHVLFLLNFQLVQKVCLQASTLLLKSN
jgi:hypothetical protein